MERRGFLIGAAGTLVAGVAQATPANAAIPAGWSNDFTTHANGWSSVRGTWVRNAALGEWRGTGIPGYWASSRHTGSFADFAYTVRMRREGTNAALASNSIFIRGDTSSLNAAGEWVPLDVFSVTNSGMASVWRVNTDGSHTVLMPWTSYPFLASAPWKTMRVTAQGTFLVLEINGRRLWAGRDNLSYGSGVPGIGFFTEEGSTGRLRVDSASMNVIPTRHRSFGLGPTVAGSVRGGGSIYRAPA